MRRISGDRLALGLGCRLLSGALRVMIVILAGFEVAGEAIRGRHQWMPHALQPDVATSQSGWLSPDDLGSATVARRRCG